MIDLNVTLIITLNAYCLSTAIKREFWLNQRGRPKSVLPWDIYVKYNGTDKLK